MDTLPTDGGVRTWSMIRLTESPDLVSEQAYLVARGVRALALVGHCDAIPATMLRVATAIEVASVPGTIPFVIDRGDGCADYGFAAQRWVLELYRWLVTEQQNAVPDEHRHRILALLLGYSADAVDRFEQEASGRLFAVAASSASRG